MKRTLSSSSPVRHARLYRQLRHQSMAPWQSKKWAFIYFPPYFVFLRYSFVLAGILFSVCQRRQRVEKTCASFRFTHAATWRSINIFLISLLLLLSLDSQAIGIPIGDNIKRIHSSSSSTEDKSKLKKLKRPRPPFKLSGMKKSIKKQKSSTAGKISNQKKSDDFSAP